MWILPSLAPVELTTYLRLLQKYYVAAVSSKQRSSKTFERQEILGTRMGHTICRLIIPVWLKFLQKRPAFPESPIYSEIKDLSNNRRKHSKQDRFVVEQTRMKWNIVGMYRAIYRFLTILLMYIYRKATKGQVKMVLKTSLEYILSKIILILIYQLGYFFLILFYLLMPVRKVFQ